MVYNAQWAQMPKTLSTLNIIKTPQDNGWSVTEVLEGMTPYIKMQARRYATTQCPFDECIANGYEGVICALRNDKAIAPFAKYAFWWIRTKIRRPAMTSGLMRRGERSGDLGGKRGGAGWEITGSAATLNELGLSSGYTMQPDDFKKARAKQLELLSLIEKAIKKSDEAAVKELEAKMIDIEERRDTHLISIDVPIGDESHLIDVLENSEVSHIKKQEISDMVHVLITKADLTKKQKTALVFLYGLEGEKEHGATEVAKRLDISKARVGHIHKRCLEKLREAALDEKVGVDDPDVEEIKKLCGITEPDFDYKKIKGFKVEYCSQNKEFVASLVGFPGNPMGFGNGILEATTSLERDMALCIEELLGTEEAFDASRLPGFMLEYRDEDDVFEARVDEWVGFGKTMENAIENLEKEITDGTKRIFESSEEEQNSEQQEVEHQRC